MTSRPPLLAAEDAGSVAAASTSSSSSGIVYRAYAGEADLPLAMSLVDAELSEPYSIFTYRYFLRNWPHLCFLAFDTKKPEGGGIEGDGGRRRKQQQQQQPPPGSRGGGCHHSVPTEEGDCFGVIINKMDDHRGTLRGYVAMLVVSSTHRGRGVGRELVSRAVRAMAAAGAAEAALEAEATNAAALRLYEGLGFLRDKRLARYYLNGADAFRLKLRLPRREEEEEEVEGGGAEGEEAMGEAEEEEEEEKGEGEKEEEPQQQLEEAVASLALAA